MTEQNVNENAAEELTIESTLEEKNAELARLGEEYAEKIRKTYEDIAVPQVKKMTNYDGDVSLGVDFSIKLVETDGVISPKISDVTLSVVFNDPMPPQHDTWAIAEEHAKRLLFEGTFQALIEAQQNQNS